MSYDPTDAWYEERDEAAYSLFGPQWAEDHADELFGEAVERFTKERLLSYYLAHPDLAVPAHAARQYSRSLLDQYPRAAVLFAALAIELTVKTVLLQPIVNGLVHDEALAEFITKLATRQTRGIEAFQELLTAILKQHGGIDFKTFQRGGSTVILYQEIKEIENARNSIAHAGNEKYDDLAPKALNVANTLLDEIFPKVLQQLGLHLHEPVTICDKSHK
jgi:hypothetical protein